MSNAASSPSKPRKTPKPRTRKDVPPDAPEGAQPAVEERSKAAPDYAARFRSLGTVSAHECPNGHGATEPVEPGHTWCPKCCAHWTVVAPS